MKIQGLDKNNYSCLNEIAPSKQKKGLTTMDSHPIILCPAVIGGGKISFRLPNKEVVVEMPARAGRMLVALCNGVRSADEIIKTLAKCWQRQSVERLIKDLMDNEVLLDGRDISPFMWQFIQNPTRWMCDLSDRQVVLLMLDTSLQKAPGRAAHALEAPKSRLRTVLEKRESTRSFGSRSIPQKTLTRLLWAAYGTTNTRVRAGSGSIPRRTVPSAGALYPIVINLVLWKRVGRILAGVYRITYDRPHIAQLRKLRAPPDELRSCFIDRTNIRHATGVVIISGSINRAAAKYANRSVLTTILEAGHAAQNTHLAAAEAGVATLEVGGFVEDRLAELLNVPPQVMPLTTVLFGAHQRAEGVKFVEPPRTLSHIISRVEVADSCAGGYTLPFAMAFAEVMPEEGMPWWACGRDPDPKMARAKAIAEAVEWHTFGNPDQTVLVQSPFELIRDRAVDPRAIIRYAARSARLRELEPFDATRPYEWVPATELTTGVERLVLADLVYFPYKPPRGKRYAIANSSGCAAHPDRKQAVTNALLELVEREAFMVTWLQRLARSHIRTRTLSGSIQKRIRALRTIGFRTSIIDLTFDLTPVIGVVAMNRKLPMLTCSAASAFDATYALEKALREVEASAYCRLRDGPADDDMDPERVREPEDHAALYEQFAAIREARFLEKPGSRTIAFRLVSGRKTPRSLTELVDKIVTAGLEPLVIEPSHNTTTHSFSVVRAMVPGMMSLEFGTHFVPVGNKRLWSLPALVHQPRGPCTQRSLNQFPHPFN